MGKKGCMPITPFTLSTAYNEQIDAKKTARCRRVLVATKLFNIAVNYFDAKKVVGGTQCNATSVTVTVTDSLCVNMTLSVNDPLI